MSGFGKKQEKKSKTKVINEDEYDKLVKKYKRIKKFMNSPLHELKRISGEKTIVEELIDEYENNLDDYYEKNPEPSEEEEYDEHPAQEPRPQHLRSSFDTLLFPREDHPLLAGRWKNCL